jgi:hypothetical protein
MFEKKVSKCDGINKKSKHQDGLAIDFIPYPFNGDWEDTKPFEKIHMELSMCARHLGFEPIDIIDWDKGHFAIKQ